MKFPLFLLFILFYFSAVSQTELDSLQDLFEKATTDSSRAKMLNEISLAYLTQDPIKAEDYARKAIDLSKKTNFKQSLAVAYNNMGLALKYQSKQTDAMPFFNDAVKIGIEINNYEIAGKSLINIGNIYSDKGETKEEEKAYLQAYEFFKKSSSKTGMAQVKGNIAMMYEEEGDLPKALSMYIEALKIAREAAEKTRIATMLNSIGKVYYDMKKFKEAIENYNEALQIFKQIGNIRRVGYCYNNLGNVYGDMKDFAKSQEYYLKALEVREKTQDKKGLANTLNNIGMNYDDMKQPEKALQYYNRSLKVKEELGDKKGMISTLTNIASIEQDKKNYSTAVELLDRAYQLSVETHSIRLKSMISKDLAIVYGKTGKTEKAFKLMWEYADLKDSLLSEESMKQMQDLQVSFETEKKVSQIKDLQKSEKIHSLELKEQENNIARQRLILFSLGGGVLLLIGLAVFIFRGYRQKKRANDRLNIAYKTIEEKNAVVEEKNKEILDSIHYAKRLQNAILPPHDFISAHLNDYFIFYQPKDIVAGDFYWMEVVLSSGCRSILIAAADCTGHGVPGALVSVVCSTALNRAVKEFGLTVPGEILTKTRELVLETFEKSLSEVKDGMDISLASLQFSSENLPAGQTRKISEIKWSGANNPLWFFSNNKINEITAHKQAIGKTDNPTAFPTHQIHANEGDMIYLFTDGYADQFGGPKGKKFKYKQLQDILINSSQQTSEAQKNILHQRFEEWKLWPDANGKKQEMEQIDDVCVIGIRI